MKSLDSTFYPTYINGESVYSWVARFHLSRPYSSWHNTNYFLFGKDHVRLHSVIPAYLGMISLHSRTSEETLLFNATGYSLFAYMQENVTWSKNLKKALILEDGGRIAALANLCSSKLPFRHCLKYCPECLEMDKAAHGTSYWHTQHQLYGVWSCPIHGLRLLELPCGDGGVNRNYVLPQYIKGRSKKATKTIQELSKQIINSHNFLNAHKKPIFPSNAYYLLLKDRGYITDGGNLRWMILLRDMQEFWRDLFENSYLNDTKSITDFPFVPALVHTNKRIHYFKHSLLIGFLCSNIQYIATPTPLFDYENDKLKNIPSQKKSCIADEKALKQINQGESLRSISKSIGRSIGYLIQLAKRNSIKTEHRTKFITPEIERSIWRQAFMGKHRAEIAKNHYCSIGAVEQIIQSHKMLSKWRAHIRHQTQLRKCRTIVIDFRIKNPNAPRGKIQQLCRSEYTWLYKFDRVWLYAQLPSKLPIKYQINIDWAARDRELAKRIKFEVEDGKSLSAIDRQLCCHGWLTRYKERFPRAVKTAIKIIKRSTK